MPKTDLTKYASEVPAVLAWDSKYTSSEFEIAKELALMTSKSRFVKNYQLSLTHKEMIENDMKRRGYDSVKDIKWQGNNNRNQNGSPSDIVYQNHEVGGVAVKDMSDIIGNFGTKDFDLNIERPRGEDLFRHLATHEFDALLRCVKQDLISELPIGQTWSEERFINYGKYAITRVSEDRFQLKFGSTKKTLSKKELITETFVNNKGIEKKLPGKWRRVFGDYYQERKKKYRKERDALYKVLYPKIHDLCVSLILSDPMKACQLGGFTDKPYYLSDLHNDRVYFIRSKDEVASLLEIDIYDKDKDQTFGSGFEIGCKIKLRDSSEYATIDFYICYNSGTFNRGPVIKIQNYRHKENLWQRVS